jgi:hypothetical protein
LISRKPLTSVLASGAFEGNRVQRCVKESLLRLCLVMTVYFSLTHHFTFHNFTYFPGSVMKLGRPSLLRRPPSFSPSSTYLAASELGFWMTPKNGLSSRAT